MRPAVPCRDCDEPWLKHYEPKDYSDESKGYLLDHPYRPQESGLREALEVVLTDTPVLTGFSGFNDGFAAGWKAASRPPEPLDVDALRTALDIMWAARNGNDGHIWSLPIPPDERTAKALAATYQAVLARAKEVKP